MRPNLTCAGYALVALLCFGCAGQEPAERESELTLDTLLADIDQLATPAGADGPSFAMLKRSLADALVAAGKQRYTTALPAGENATVDNLTLGGSVEELTITWTYANRGDYDQNSQVTIGDLTTLGANLGKTTASPDWSSKAVAADGDLNGVVSISDITPLGANLMASIDGYRVEATQTPEVASSWSELEFVPFAAGELEAGNALRLFSFSFAPDFGVTHLRVRAVSGEEMGNPSNEVQYNNVPPTPPAIDGVTGTTGDAGAQLQLTAQLSGGAPQTYSWDFGGAGNPGTSSLAAPTITLGPDGVFDASLTVTNSAGSDTHDFQITVNPVIDPPQISSVLPPAASVGEEVQFLATVAGTEPLTYAWDFGGGATPSTSSDEFPIVTAGAAGNYNMSLTVSNAAGFDTFAFTFIIGGSEAAPIIRDVGWTSTGTETFSEFSADLSGGTPTTWIWTFNGAGTPDPANEPMPLILLGEIGVYNCNLFVSNGAGSDSKDFVFEVTPDSGGNPPNILFVSPTTGIQGENVEFTPTFIGNPPISWTWDFGGGTIPGTSQSETPDVTLLEPGDYTVSVHASNAYGFDDFEFTLKITQ